MGAWHLFIWYIREMGRWDCIKKDMAGKIGVCGAVGKGAVMLFGCRFKHLNKGDLEQLVFSLKFPAGQLVEGAVFLAVGANLESETARDRL